MYLIHVWCCFPIIPPWLTDDGMLDVTFTIELLWGPRLYFLPSNWESASMVKNGKTAKLSEANNVYNGSNEAYTPPVQAHWSQEL